MTEQEFWAALTTVVDPLPPTYRLYYGDHGEPLFYSMENLPGKYVSITHETYSNPPTHCRVIDGVFTVLKTNPVTKLQPSDTGTPCYPTDVSIVVDLREPHTKWMLK